MNAQRCNFEVDWEIILYRQQKKNYYQTWQLFASTGVAAALERALSRYLGEVTTSAHVVDKREPEYTLYGPTRATLNVYKSVWSQILCINTFLYRKMEVCRSS